MRTSLLRPIGWLLGRMLWPVIWLHLNGSNRTRAIIVHKEQVLLVKGYLSSRKYELPGGDVKRGETIQDSINRELHEELGFVPDLHFWKTIKAPLPLLGYIHQSVFIANLSQKAVFTPRKELCEVRWVRFDQALMLLDQHHKAVLKVGTAALQELRV